MNPAKITNEATCWGIEENMLNLEIKVAQSQKNINCNLESINKMEKGNMTYIGMD